MTDELLWTYAFNLIINSLFSFLTTTSLIYLLITILRIKQLRLKSLLLALPLIKLLLDPFLYNFENWALLDQVNLLQLESGSRSLNIALKLPTNFLDFFSIQFSTLEGQTFSLADLIVLSISSEIIRFITIFMGSVSLILFGRYLIRLRTSIRAISKLVENAILCPRQVQNSLLISKIKEKKCELIVSSEITTPCAFGIFHKRICFPHKLCKSLQQKEFEAILAHELDHLRWYDNLVRMFCQIISRILWWVPTFYLFQHMKCVQERACDSNIEKFKISPLDLASAIVKTTKASDCPIGMACFAQESTIVKRIKSLLKPPIKRSKKFKLIQIVLTLIVTILVLLGRFWIF